MADPEIRLYTGGQPQLLVMAIFVGLMAAVGGLLYGYDTGLVNLFMEMNYVLKHFPADGQLFAPHEASIITASLSIGTFVGALLAPLLSDTIGRKWAIICACVFVFNVGTLLQLAALEITLMCVGRVVTGLSVGIILAVVPLYQAEALPKWVRGAIVSTYQWAITWGLLISLAVLQGTHLLESLASYRVPISLQYVWSALLTVGMFFLPELPRFYVKQELYSEAAESLSRLRRVPPDDPGLLEELVEITANFEYEHSFGKSSFRDCFRLHPGDVGARQELRMITGIVVQALQQCTGINFIFYYGVNFFVRSGINRSYLILFVTYAVNVVATVPGILLVEVLGRRKILIYGGVAMAIANLTIAIVGVTTDSAVANKVMVGLVCVFIALFAASWGPVAWVLVGEIYSLGIRGKAVAITAATNWLMNMVFALITPYLVDSGKNTALLGLRIFFIWGACNVAGVVFVYFFVYETKGLRLEEVDDMYRHCAGATSSARWCSSRTEIRLRKHSEMADTEAKTDLAGESGDGMYNLTMLGHVPTYGIGHDLNIINIPNQAPPDDSSDLGSSFGSGEGEYDEYVQGYIDSLNLLAPRDNPQAAATDTEGSPS